MDGGDGGVGDGHDDVAVAFGAGVVGDRVLHGRALSTSVAVKDAVAVAGMAVGVVWPRLIVKEPEVTAVSFGSGVLLKLVTT